MARIAPRAGPLGRGRHGSRYRPTDRRPRAPRARRKPTFYRYRRGIPPAARQTALILIALLLTWWAAGALRHHARPAALPTRRISAPSPVSRPRPRPQPAPPELAMAGGPSLDATRVDGILAAYGSPLHGQGPALVQLSRHYGIDDAVALAFFVMESRAGTQGEAVLTHSFGNLRPMPHQPERDGYRYYRTWLESAGEWFQVVRSLYLDKLRLATVEAAVPVYAPASDNNDPAAMIEGIRQLVRCWRGAIEACPDDPAGLRSLIAIHRSH